MTSKTTTKANRKTATRTARKKSHRINRQRRLQKQLQALLLERHSRRCIICHHPEREAIEEEFVHWRAPWKLSQDYKLNDYRTVYRHARAAGLLLQRRERLHSALDAFVESVDDVTFTGDTILRAMRAYSCIDSHGRWTEIPTQVQFYTSNDAHPPQPPTPSPRSGSTTSDTLDIVPKYSNRASRSDATACAASHAQAFNEEDEEDVREEHVTASDVLDVFRKYGVQASRNDATAAEDQYDELEDDDSNADSDDDDESEDDAENELDELVTASDVSNVVRRYANQTPRSDATTDDDELEEAAENELEKLVTSRLTSSKSPSRSDTTACATSPAQAVNVTEDDYADPEDDEYEDFEDDPEDDPDDDDPKNNSEADRLEETTACAAPPAQPASAVPLNSNNRGRSVTATACADSPAQALPRDVVRGQNPNDRSPSDRTDCAALPSGGAPAQPAAPQKPKPDADGLIWHPHPGYPNQERSEPDAQGRVFYKIHMTTAAANLPPRETDAQRAAKLIYGSVIKKYGNP
jgi:hypothetical protein